MDDHAGQGAPPEAVGAFRFAGSLTGSASLPGGHIHRNFLVTCTGGRYVLQRLNDHVFGDIDTLLGNVERIVTHLRSAGRRVPDLVETHEGALALRAVDGSTWRAFAYLEGTVGRDTVSGTADAFEAARLLADYVVALRDLPGPDLTATIGHFHDLSHRLAALDAVAAADPVGRRPRVGDELDRARRLGHQMVAALGDGGRAISRTVHNDAKLSNVRFDSGDGRAACVIDFDTTMPGLIRHDVGELVRTATTRAPEDADVSAVDFDPELLAALCAGYFAAPVALAPSELDTLALAGPEMALENALRFLTDHLAGDHYFAVARPAQNLDRCRNQLRLTELMLDGHGESAACFARACRHSPTDGRTPGVGGRHDGGPS